MVVIPQTGESQRDFLFGEWMIAECEKHNVIREEAQV
jgi:hypothetical protein